MYVASLTPLFALVTGFIFLLLLRVGSIFAAACDESDPPPPFSLLTRSIPTKGTLTSPACQSFVPCCLTRR